MSNYHRSTRECLFDQLRPELQHGLREYFDAHEWGEIETQELQCCETVVEIKGSNWLPTWLGGKRETTSYIGIILTEQTLVWVREQGTRVNVTGARLVNIRTRTLHSTFSKEIKLEITGLIENAAGIITGVIGLGPEPAAQIFCDEVCQTIEKVNPDVARKWPRWMGGS